MDGCHFQILLDALSDLVSVYCTKMVEPTADMVSVLTKHFTGDLMAYIEYVDVII